VETTLRTVPKQRVRINWWERNLRYVLIAPCVLMIVGIGLFPLIYSLGVSFLRWDVQRRGREFIFLQNYIDALGDGRMWGALGHTFLIMVVAVVCELLLGLGLALVLVGRLPGKQVIIPLLLMPVVTAPIVVGNAWRLLWDTRFGPISDVISRLLGYPLEIVWLANPRTVYPVILLAEIWQWTPFMFLVLLAGLASINPELHEAASMDGASGWQIFYGITLPLVWPVVTLAVLFRALDLFKLFDIIFALTMGGPGTQTETISLYVYTLGFRNFRLGYTAAMSYILLIIVSIFITLLWRRLSEQRED